MGFKKVDVKTLDMKPFEKIGSEWMLISAAKDGKANTMTASWGGIRDRCIITVRRWSARMEKR